MYKKSSKILHVWILCRFFVYTFGNEKVLHIILYSKTGVLSI